MFIDLFGAAQVVANRRARATLTFSGFTRLSMTQLLVNRSLRIFTIVVMLMPLAACRRTRSGLPVADDSPLSPVATEIQRRGYRVVKRPIAPPTVWEASNFRMRSRRVVSFKAEQPMPNSQHYYYRFTLIEETYDSDDDARRRLADLHRAVPDRPFENEYELTLRDGFRVGTKTFILQTDGSIFWDEVRNLTRALANSIDGAEPARVSVATPPNSLDHSGGSVVCNLIGLAELV